MSKHVDALILIAHGSRIAADVPEYVHEDTEQGVASLYKGDTVWYDGTPITEADTINLQASEVILKLGRITASMCLQTPISCIRNTNRFKFSTIDRIQEIVPLGETEPLNVPIEVGNRFWGYSEYGLPLIFKKALAHDPSLFAELTAKWAISQEIHKKRGTVTIPGYAIDELRDGISRLAIDEIAPLDSTGASYDVGDVIDHAGIDTRLIDFPYYSTLREQENGTELLESALEDLTSVSHAMRE